MKLMTLKDNKVRIDVTVRKNIRSNLYHNSLAIVFLLQHHCLSMPSSSLVICGILCLVLLSRVVFLIHIIICSVCDSAKIVLSVNCIIFIVEFMVQIIVEINFTHY